MTGCRAGFEGAQFRPTGVPNLRALETVGQSDNTPGCGVGVGAGTASRVTFTARAGTIYTVSMLCLVLICQTVSSC